MLNRKKLEANEEIAAGERGWNIPLLDTVVTRNLTIEGKQLFTDIMQYIEVHNFLIGKVSYYLYYFIDIALYNVVYTTKKYSKTKLRNIAI